MLVPFRVKWIIDDRRVCLGALVELVLYTLPPLFSCGKLIIFWQNNIYSSTSNSFSKRYPLVSTVDNKKNKMAKAKNGKLEASKDQSRNLDYIHLLSPLELQINLYDLAVFCYVFISMDAMKLPKHSKMGKIKAEGRVSVDKDTIKHVQLIIVK